MSTELVKQTEQYPVLAGGVEDVLEAVETNLGGEEIRPSDLDRIRVPAGGGLSWQIESGLGGDEEARVVEGVIVHHQLQRAYWREDFEGASNPPDCVSYDSLVGIGDPGGSCRECPHAQFADDGSGQACKQTRTIFLLRPEEMLPSVLVIPPSGLAPMKRYLLALAKRGRKVTGAITRFELEKDKSSGGITYSRVKPSLVGFLPKEQAEAMGAYAASMRPHLQRVAAEEVAPEEPGQADDVAF